MTTQEISTISENKIVNIYSKVGTFGKSTQMQILKETSRFTGETFFFVVTREGFLKYMGNALIAIYEGSINKDYMKFKTATQVFNFINK